MIESKVITVCEPVERPNEPMEVDIRDILEQLGIDYERWLKIRSE